MYFTKRFYSIEIVQIHCIHCLALMACPAFVRSSLHVVPRVEAQRTVLAGMLRVVRSECSLAVPATLLLMITKQGQQDCQLTGAGDTRTINSQVTGNGSGELRSTTTPPLSGRFPLGLIVNSKCVSFETDPTLALEKI